MKQRIKNRVNELRKASGIAASELAGRVGVSRQTIYAIEAGAFVPNTEVALLLARELDTTIDQLFALERSQTVSPNPLDADILAEPAPFNGQRIRLARVGKRWVGAIATASPCYIPEADAVVARVTKGRAAVSMFANHEPADRVLLAGCDPASGLVARIAEKTARVELVCAAASSSLALRWLKQGRVHIAGSHLEDAATGEFNLPFLRKHFPRTALTVVSFARWEEGLVVAPGNPKGLRGVDDLARRTVKFVNREPGSGSRALLDSLLAQSGMLPTAVRGYDDVAYGHLAAAYRVASGGADACLATRSAALSFGLGFVPVHAERYDLVMRRETAELPAVKAFLDVLQSAALRRHIEAMAGYDTAEMGSVHNL
jgi:putative molybdopterin biosynthesis protein